MWMTSRIYGARGCWSACLRGLQEPDFESGPGTRPVGHERDTKHEDVVSG
jgi:hypothetical protein